MCILFVYTDPVPRIGRFRLILASNRDEYYVRPAENVTNNLEEQIIAGRDMEPGREGGMWLGLSTKTTKKAKVRIGVLLNLSGEDKIADSKDRGPVVANYLKSNQNADDYVSFMRNNGRYKPHNFVAVELNKDETSVYHSCNVPLRLNKYEGKQFLGFGNSTSEVPFVKVTKGCERFKEVVEKLNNVEEQEELIQQLIGLLKWDEKHFPDPELERRNPSASELLSSVFVRILQAGYGTRAHSVILVDYDWNIEFVEISMEQPINPEEPAWTINSCRSKI